MAGAELVLVFAKPAVPGAVKTRLVPPLSPAAAAELHLALLDDVLATAKGAAGRAVELCVAGGPDAHRDFGLRYPGLEVAGQRGRDLGARLANAFADSFRRGFARTLILGSDHPTLPAKHVSRGLAELRARDLVFGPSSDGGYYAVGVRRAAWPASEAVFQDIPWSTSRVLEASLAQARASGLSYALLPEWYDVDRPQDLERLREDLDPRSAVARLLSKIQT